MRRFIPKAQFRRLLAAQDGTTAIEYAIIASGIAGVLIATVATLGGSLKTMWTAVAAALQQRPRCPQTRPFVVSASP
jgi:pilus assembly protein Flp/PilA